MFSYTCVSANLLARQNDCMTPSSHDGFFFKIAWDNQCGHATSAPFELPAGAVALSFIVGGGANHGGLWVHRAADNAILCSFVGPPTCPLPA